jgi:hypothetical protein
MPRFTAGYEAQFKDSHCRSVASGRNGRAPVGGGNTFDVNKLGAGGKLTGADMANLRTMLAEKTSHGHQNQTINLRKTQMAARNIITPPWGSSRGAQKAAKKAYKTPGVGAGGVTKITVGVPKYHGESGGTDINYAQKKRPGKLIQRETEEYKHHLMEQAKHSHYHPSSHDYHKKKLQDSYRTNLRAISTVPNALLNNGDVSVEDGGSGAHGRKRFEEAPPQISMHDPLPADHSDSYVSPETMAQYNDAMNKRRPFC